MEEYANGSHIGFIRAPQSTYVPDLGSMTGKKWMGNYGENVWCCDTNLNHTKLYLYSQGKRDTSLNCTKIVVGDRFGVKLNMKEKTCEVLHNGKNLGVVFRDLPSEVSPAVSSGYNQKGKIRFVKGRRRRV